MKNNRKAMELSVNFVVMLIIALVIFGMGLVLFKRFFVEAENIKQDLDEQTRRELTDRMMSSSEQVIIYPTQLKVNKGKGDVFGVGILNTGTALDNNFEIDSKFQKGYDIEGREMTSIPGNCFVNPIECPVSVMSLLERTIEPNKREVISIPFRVKSGVDSGKYSILVEVRQSGSSISKNLVYIEVS